MGQRNGMRKNASKKRLDRKTVALLTLLFLLEFAISGFLTGQLRIILSGRAFQRVFTLGEILKEGFLTVSGIVCTLGLFFLAGLFTILFLKRKGMLNRTVTKGKHGERLTKEGTLGHSRMMTLEEAGDHFDVSEDINDHFDFLFGYVEDENDHARIKKIFGHRKE